MLKNDGKRAWIYYRLSRDDDKELNSLINQKRIVEEYAARNEYEVVGMSFDDNISGMHFNREGIDKVRDAAIDGIIDVVLVKDMSRLGRHRLETPLFIEMLRKENVKVVSVTEGIDTFNENDDLHIAIKQFMNDFYSKDISRKIRAGFKQKQREGMVLIPPFGFKKDLVTKEITICEETAEVVRLIYRLYTEGIGQKKITIYLNDHRYKAPAYYMKLFYNREIGSNPHATEHTRNFLWSSKTVYEILRNKAYIGVLESNKTTKSSIYKYRKQNDPSEWIVHEDFYPRIISDELFNLVQELKAKRGNNNIRAKNQKIHRYAGLVKCGNCGAGFSARRRTGYIEYVCNSYHKNGINYCSSHRIRQDKLDEIVDLQMDRLREVAKENIQMVTQFLDDYRTQKVDLTKSIDDAKNEIYKLEENIKHLIREGIDNPNRKQYIDEIIEEDEDRINELCLHLDKLKSNQKTATDISIGIVDTVSLLENALENGLSDAYLQYFVNKVVVTEVEDKQFDIDVELNVPFINHFNRPLELETYRYNEATSP